jgi:hypothetical protein
MLDDIHQQQLILTFNMNDIHLKNCIFYPLRRNSLKKEDGLLWLITRDENQPLGIISSAWMKIYHLRQMNYPNVISVPEVPDDINRPY